MFMLNELLIKDLIDQVDINKSDIQYLKSTTIFSTTERKIGQWDDGKDLYEKTIKITSGSVPTEIDISNLNYDYAYVEKMIIDYISGGNRFIRHEFNLSGNEYFISFIRKDTVQIRNTISNIGTFNSLRVVLRYTKATN